MVKGFKKGRELVLNLCHNTVVPIVSACPTKYKTVLKVNVRVREPSLDYLRTVNLKVVMNINSTGFGLLGMDDFLVQILTIPNFSKSLL